jgi:hypothetical protein
MSTQQAASDDTCQERHMHTLKSFFRAKLFSAVSQSGLRGLPVTMARGYFFAKRVSMPMLGINFSRVLRPGLPLVPW